MDTNSEERVSMTADLTINRYFFCIFNAVIMLPFVFREFSWINLAVGVIAILLTFALSLVGKTQKSGGESLTVLGLIDLLLVLALHFEQWRGEIHPAEIAVMLRNFHASQALVLAAAFLLIYVGKAQSDRWFWCRELGILVIGFWATFVRWSNGNVFRPELVKWGATILAVYLILAAVWLLLCLLSSYTVRARVRNLPLTIVFVALVLAFDTVLSDFLQASAPKLREFLLTLPAGMFRWWKVLLLAALILVSAVICIGSVDKGVKNRLETGKICDGLTLLILAFSILLIRVLLSNYFSFSWVLFVCFAMVGVIALWDAASEKEILHLMAPVDFLVVQFVLFLLAVFLLRAGYWMNVAVSAAFGLLLYQDFLQKKIRGGGGERVWFGILAGIAAEVLAYLWVRRFSLESLMMLTVMLVLALAAMRILLAANASGRRPPKAYLWTVCLILAALSLGVCRRYGVNIRAEYNGEEQRTVVSMAAVGAENEVRSAEYRWLDWKGSVLEEGEIRGEEKELRLRGERLEITATDEMGVRSLRVYFYPGWLIER